MKPWRDVEGIADLIRQVRAVGKRLVGNRVKVHVSVNTLIPKAHTAFQWLGFSEKESILEKYRLLQNGLKSTGIKLDWPDYDKSMLEVWLSRGDRRLSTVIETAWRAGARFDAWHEYFNVDIWQKAFSDRRPGTGFLQHPLPLHRGNPALGPYPYGGFQEILAQRTGKKPHAGNHG